MLLLCNATSTFNIDNNPICSHLTEQHGELVPEEWQACLRCNVLTTDLASHEQRVHGLHEGEPGREIEEVVVRFLLPNQTVLINKFRLTAEIAEVMLFWLDECRRQGYRPGQGMEVVVQCEQTMLALEQFETRLCDLGARQGSILVLLYHEREEQEDMTAEDAYIKECADRLHYNPDSHPTTLLADVVETMNTDRNHDDPSPMVEEMIVALRREDSPFHFTKFPTNVNQNNYVSIINFSKAHMPRAYENCLSLKASNKQFEVTDVFKVAQLLSQMSSMLSCRNSCLQQQNSVFLKAGGLTNSAMDGLQRTGYCQGSSSYRLLRKKLACLDEGLLQLSAKETMPIFLFDNMDFTLRFQLQHFTQVVLLFKEVKISHLAKNDAISLEQRLKLYRPSTFLLTSPENHFKLARYKLVENTVMAQFIAENFPEYSWLRKHFPKHHRRQGGGEVYQYQEADGRNVGEAGGGELGDVEEEPNLLDVQAGPAEWQEEGVGAGVLQNHGQGGRRAATTAHVEKPLYIQENATLDMVKILKWIQDRYLEILRSAVEDKEKFDEALRAILDPETSEQDLYEVEEHVKSCCRKHGELVIYGDQLTIENIATAIRAMKSCLTILGRLELITCTSAGMFHVEMNFHIYCFQACMKKLRSLSDVCTMANFNLVLDKTAVISNLADNIKACGKFEDHKQFFAGIGAGYLFAAIKDTLDTLEANNEKIQKTREGALRLIEKVLQDHNIQTYYDPEAANGDSHPEQERQGDGQDGGQDDLSKYASNIASRALLGQIMQHAEREGDSEAIMAVRIAMVAFFFGASGNRSKYSPTLMDNIVDYLSSSTSTRRRMDEIVTANLTGAPGCNIHPDKLNEQIIKQQKSLIRSFQRSITDNLLTVSVAASNQIRIIKNHTYESLDLAHLQGGGEHASKVFRKSEEEKVRQVISKWTPFSLRFGDDKVEFEQSSTNMWDFNYASFDEFVSTKHALYEKKKTP